jgi:signal transduction histidine kinase
LRVKLEKRTIAEGRVMETIAEISASRFDRQSAHRLWQLAMLERAVLASLGESHDTSRALHELALGLERIAAPGTLVSILTLDELSEGRLRYGASASLPAPFVAQIDGRQLGPRAGSCGTAAWRRSPVIVTDIGSDPLWEEYRDVALACGLRACWSVPISSTGGEILGTFAFYYRESRAPAREDLVTLEGAARLARMVLERERADRARRRAARRDQALFAAARVLARAEDVTPALRELLGAVGGALSWDTGAVWLLDPEAGSLGCVAHWSKDDARFADFLTDRAERRLLPGDGLPGRVTRSGEPEWLATSTADAAFLRSDAATAAGLHHGLAFPIRAANEVLGAVELFTDVQEGIDIDLLVALRTVGLQVGQFLSRARAQADRQHLIDELRETLRFSELFASILAHDLRNPLNTMVMGTQVLMNDANPRALSVLSRMQNSGGRMARMIEQLLDLTRSRKGNGLALLRESLHLGDLSSSMVNELALAYPTARMDLQVEGDTLGQWDRDRLAQVLSNLIGNAIEHGDPGSTLTLRLEGHADSVTLETHNSGTIVPEALPTLFDPFKPLRPGAKRSSGLGLGLYITHLIVAAHGGSISVSSSSLGTRFHVQLPRTAAAESAPVTRYA